MIYCNIEDLRNESDVEQKLCVPLITTSSEKGLGYSKSDYSSKKTLKKMVIGKSGDKKSYRPDFITFIQGTPVLVIEAKSPEEDLTEGYREARLYANELNAIYPSGINPCTKVLVTNGKEIWYGKNDEREVFGKLTFKDINISNKKFTDLLDFCSKSKINNELETVIKKTRSKKNFSKPTAILGGKASREEELGSNTFGSALMYEYQRIFNPETREDRVEIVRNAYIPSTGIEKHKSPIRKLILATLPPSLKNTTKIENTSKPRELLSKLLSPQRLSNQLILLIGNVGSGKTTFIDYLREIVLPTEIKNKTTWVYIDLNFAPNTKDEIYPWVQEKIVAQLKDTHQELNLDHIDELKKLYAGDIEAFEIGEGSLLRDDPKEYNKLLAKLIQEAKADKNKTAKAYTRYLCGDRGKTFILILDNGDKRNKEDQLLMFEVARWAKEEFRALIFLSLRDVTYDLHKTEPPLDTVIKDMAFRIDPPELSQVLYRRVAYAIQNSPSRGIKMTLNNMVVNISKKEQDMYLKCILESLYNSSPFSRKLINGLAGRDLRRGIEIFITFCRSGHISNKEILKMRVSNGSHPLEEHIVLRALLRGSKRFYSGRDSYIKNLFESYPDEEVIPDPFVRMSILKWFQEKKAIRGPSDAKGFHPIADLETDLQLIGHNEKRVRSEVVNLLRERCLISEAQTEEILAETDPKEIEKGIEDNDLIKIAPAGTIHLDLLLNIVYLSACAEDIWYWSHQTATTIKERLTREQGVGHYSLSTNLKNSSDLIDYLIDYQKKYYPNNETIIDKDIPRIDLQTIKKFVSERELKVQNKNSDLKRRYPFNKELVCSIERIILRAGIRVLVEPGVYGFIMKRDIRQAESFQQGKKVKVRVNGLDEDRSTLILSLIEK
ncbi:MAG: hypothetical protein HYT93_00630 [Parcubacteria group bacterium]|nr:hypothetical protein [Parcubacteria group bacterium]